MTAIILIYIFLLGVIIGSFMNVVILRHNTGKTVGGRSACMTCRTRLGGRELIPLLSFLIQRGKCRHCATRISLQYPAVELVTGLLFAVNFYYIQSFSGLSLQTFITFALTSAIFALLVAIFVYDVRHKIIPDSFSFSAFGLSIVYALSIYVWKGGLSFGTLGVYDFFAGLLFYVGIYLMWRLSSGRLIGLGDAKLLLTIGTVLGLVYGLSAIFVSVWLGMIFVIFLVLKGFLGQTPGRITMKSEIAFGPFLILGFLIVYFTKIDVTSISLLLNTF
jgi:prepilin signal peptidase PulO-like enzyme (type II secretory pathway)